jgi:hypothetical protein
MKKFFYEWEDTSDKNSTGVPDLGRYPQYRATTKAQVRQEWLEYLKDFPDLKNPKIRVWRISYEEVTL